MGGGLLSPADYRVWRSVVSSPSRVWGRAPAANDFGAILCDFMHAVVQLARLTYPKV